MSETVDTLTVYCRNDERVCPLPKPWQQLWEILAEHLQWAAKHNLLPEVAAFLRGLREDEWHHLGE